MSIPLTILLGVLRSVRERCLLLLRRSKQENRLYRICCGKSENELSLRHEQFCVCECPRALATLPVLLPGKKAREFLSCERSAQPIDKSRFGRENPRKSKEIQHEKTEVSQRKGHPPRKPKRTDRRRGAPALPRTFLTRGRRAPRLAWGVPSRFGSYLDADAVLAFVSVRWRLKSLMEAKWNVPSPVSASIEPSEKIL